MKQKLLIALRDAVQSGVEREGPLGSSSVSVATSKSASSTAAGDE